MIWGLFFYRGPGRQLARYRTPSICADISLRRAWNTIRRWHGPGLVTSLIGRQATHWSASPRLRWLEIVALYPTHRESHQAAAGAWISRTQLPFVLCHLFCLHNCSAEGGDCFPRLRPSTKAGCWRSPPPIASRRTRRCSAQAGHTSTVCSTISSGRSIQWWHPGTSSRRIRNRNNRVRWGPASAGSLFCLKRSQPIALVWLI